MTPEDEKRAALGLPVFEERPEEAPTKMTLNDALGSLDYWEEIALAQNFDGLTVFDISEKLGPVLRGVGWVVARRTDKTVTPVSFKKLTVEQAQELFDVSVPGDPDPKAETSGAS